jgi:hypothetical protein
MAAARKSKGGHSGHSTFHLKVTERPQSGDRSSGDKMTIDEIRALHRAEPFRPFKLCLSDGREYTVDIRMCLALDPTGRTVALVLPKDDLAIIEVKSIQEIKLLDRAARRNGKRPTQRKNPPKKKGS